MKKLIAAVVLSACLMVGCGEPKVIEGKCQPTYGLLNKDENKDPTIRYEVSVGNIIWTALLVETVVVPIYFIGFSLFNPIAKK
jgi:hypothetical protein